MRYICYGGPWRGKHLWLEGIATTWLNIEGEIGRYIWSTGSAADCLDWERARC